MDDVQLAAIAKVQGGVITTAQAGACGLTRTGVWHRVRAGRLFPIRRGAYTLSPVQHEVAHWWAAVLTADPDHGMLSSWSAARAHGFWSGRPRTIHVTVPWRGGRRATGLTIHTARTMRADDVVSIAGLRVTSPARTILDVAPSAGDDAVRRLIREAEFQGSLGVGDVRRAVESCPNHPGAPRVRRVDPETAESSMRQTPLEDELAAFLTPMPLPQGIAQFRQAGASGTSYAFDVAWPAIRLAVEADGRSAHQRACAFEDDRFRDGDVAAMGWITLRFTRLQLGPGAPASRQQLLATAASRGWSPGRPLELVAPG